MPDLIYVPRWPMNPGEWMECRFENGQLDGVIINCPECRHNIRVYTSDSTIGQTSVMMISHEKLLTIANPVHCPYKRGNEKCTWAGKIAGSMVERVDRGQTN